MKVRLIDAGRVDFLRSQSIYHGLGYAQKNETANTIVLAIPSKPYICIGHFQDARKELDLKYCLDNNLPVIRRQTGGGTVYIDDQQLFVQWIFQPNSMPAKVDQKFQFFIQPMIETYKYFGIEAYGYGNHDVHVNGKKIVGTGAAQIGNAEVITGNFIRDFKGENMVSALKLPNEIMRDQVANGLKEYMSSMSEELASAPEFEEIKVVYKKKCEEILGMKILEDEFREEDLLEIKRQDEKLSNDSWTYSMEQVQKDCRLIKIHTGVWVGNGKFSSVDSSMDITLGLKEDYIDFINIDFENNDPDGVRSLESELLNTHMTSEKISEKLQGFFSDHKQGWSDFSLLQWTEALMSFKNEKMKISGGG
jgi:lipoate---protein ligase